MPRRTALLAAPLALLLALPAPAQEDPPAASPPAPEAPAGDAPGLDLDALQGKAREALELFKGKASELLERLGEGADALTSYGPPRMLPNGDILIPRLKDDEGDAPGADPETAPPPASGDDTISL
ncbi:hypothetical protein ACQ5SO_21210 [Rhodovulum sp. DZ06]|uniref:hypothetical protein n=1 Tax=Rhodovulum sp. DZ06 TaxID=3425126 RepID=UPI003D336E2E